MHGSTGDNLRPAGGWRRRRSCLGNVARTRSADWRCVYYVCMARMNIYLPDDLAAKARSAGLNLSALARAAVEAELARSLTEGWLERVLALAPTAVSHDEAIEALDAAREDFGARD